MKEKKFFINPVPHVVFNRQRDFKMFLRIVQTTAVDNFTAILNENIDIPKMLFECVF